MVIKCIDNIGKCIWYMYVATHVSSFYYIDMILTHNHYTSIKGWKLDITYCEWLTTIFTKISPVSKAVGTGLSLKIYSLWEYWAITEPVGISHLDNNINQLTHYDRW